MNAGMLEGFGSVQPPSQVAAAAQELALSLDDKNPEATLLAPGIPPGPTQASGLTVAMAFLRAG